MALKAFGLELRRPGNARDLYRDVDRVLRESGVTAEHVGGQVQVATVAHALQKMFSNDGSYGGMHFSLRTVQECAAVVGITIPAERLRIYGPIHCMNWSDMTPDFRKTIMAMVLDDFREVLAPAVEEQEARIVR